MVKLLAITLLFAALAASAAAAPYDFDDEPRSMDVGFDLEDEPRELELEGEEENDNEEGEEDGEPEMRDDEDDDKLNVSDRQFWGRPARQTGRRCLRYVGRSL